MQNELKQIQRQTGMTFLYVTHEQEGALTMSDRIAVLNDGRCVQCDTPEPLSTHTASWGACSWAATWWTRSGRATQGVFCDRFCLQGHTNQP